MKHTYIQPHIKIKDILPTEMLAGSGDQKLHIGNTEVEEQGAKKGFFDDDEDATDATPSPW